MALLPNPEVLLLDEPFEAIDPVTSRIMHEVLMKAARRGTTVFLTSHILSVAERVANQFVIIRGGKMVWNSLAEELPRSLEELYLELAESPMTEELEWLGFERPSSALGGDPAESQVPWVLLRQQSLLRGSCIALHGGRGSVCLLPCDHWTRPLLPLEQRSAADSPAGETRAVAARQR